MKKLLCVVPLLILFCFTIACQDKAAMAELEKFRAQAAVEQQNEALVTRVFNELNNRNAGIYLELYAPEYGWYFPPNNPKALTREEESGFVKLLWAGFPDIRWQVEEMTARGDRVIARFIARGTHTGEYQGLRPTGNKFEISGIWSGRITNGKIVEAREEGDVLGWMQQLGMELKPIAAKKK
ncbi:MAG: ester cyclase [Candidatus Aminicenantales bacterium]